MTIQVCQVPTNDALWQADLSLLNKAALLTLRIVLKTILPTTIEQVTLCNVAECNSPAQATISCRVIEPGENGKYLACQWQLDFCLAHTCQGKARSFTCVLPVKL